MTSLSLKFKSWIKRKIGFTRLQDQISILQNQIAFIQDSLQNSSEGLTEKSSDYSQVIRTIEVNNEGLNESEHPVYALDNYNSAQFLIKTMVCQKEHFDSSWFLRWNQEINPDGGESWSPRKLRRKGWEWYAIAQALAEREMLRPGKRGLGFAVGTEPLSSLFAKYGVEVLATDLGNETETAKMWKTNNEHAATLEDLWKPNIISREDFLRHVRFENADMNYPEKITEKFDFIWSSCALEHLGGLQPGWDFVLKSSQLLNPGGIAVHTTEFNVSSNSHTLTTGDSVIYRRCDIEALDYYLRRHSMCLEVMDFSAGTSPADRQYDIPPYYQAGRHHVKLKLADHISTSLIFIVYR